MADQYAFHASTSDDEIVWDDQETTAEIHTTVDYTAADASIGESFVSTTEDNATQYLSVLEPDEQDLCDVTVAAGDHAAGTASYPDGLVTADHVNVDDQLVVFAVEGTDDLYGVQLGRDEDGNLQKYEFKLRTNEDGQLEAISETLQMLPMDDDEENQTYQVQENASEDTFKDTTTAEENLLNDEQSQKLFPSPNDVPLDSNQPILPHNDNDVEQNVQEDDFYQEEEEVDVKVGIIGGCDEMKLTAIKEEILHSLSPDDNYEEENVDYDQHTTENTAVENAEEQHFNEDANNSIQEDSAYSEENYQTTEIENEMNVEYESVDTCHYTINEEGSLVEKSKQQPVGCFDQLNINEEIINSNSATSVQEYLDNESETEDYDVVDGLHITGDIENGAIINNGITFNELPTIERSALNQLEKQSATKVLRKHQGKQQTNMLFYVVHQHSEKENLESLSLINNSSVLYNSPKITNPRSILKSSHAIIVEDRNEVLGPTELLGKRFARGKEAVQARIFHNFINKTTIPQAPVRKDRLPRKQKIRPVQRMDEEIVVQEMMISARGFVEAPPGSGTKRIETTELVELSDDSDDDYYPKQANKARRRSTKLRKARQKIEKITISDSEDNELSDSSGSIIQIVISDGEGDDDGSNSQTTNNKDEDNSNSTKLSEEQSPLKRRRGRPPKDDINDVITVSSNNDVDSLESPIKRIRIDNADVEEGNEIEELLKSEIPCPKCSKSFASQNSLRTHLQHHNLESTLLIRNAKKQVANNIIAGGSVKNTVVEYRHKCSTCGDNFKNKLLLSRHNCIAASKIMACPTCKKQFDDLQSLSNHKKLHAKEQLCKSTTISIIPHRKVIKSPHTFKSPPRPSNQCNICKKVCSSLAILNIHSKTHKQFVCTYCSSTFISRYQLQIHIRENCVKPKSPSTNKRTNLQRSISMNLSTVADTTGENKIPDDSDKKKKVVRSTLGLSLQCSSCPAQFHTHKALFEHKVLKHGLKTPDKRLSNVGTVVRKSLCRPKEVHGGIPTTKRMGDAFALLKTKLQFSGDV